MKVSISRKDNVWNILGIALSMGANFIVLPFILKFLSDDDVAIYYIFLRLSSIATLFDFGFSPSIARSMNYAYSGAMDLDREGVSSEKKEEPNYSLMGKVILTCKILYLSISIIALLIGSSVGTYYVYSITKDSFINSYLYPWIIYLAAIFLNILFSYYNVFLRGVGAVTKINVATIIARIVQILLCIILLLLGVGLIGVAIAYLIYGFLFRMISSYLFKRHNNIGNELKVNKAKFEKKDFVYIMGKMWPNTWKDGIVTISNYLVNQAMTIIAPLFLSLTLTGIFSLTTQLLTAVATIASSVLNAYQPQLQSAYANNDVESQRKTLSLCIVSYFILYIIVLIGLIFVGLPLIKIIKPSYEINYLLIISVSTSFFIVNYRNIFSSYISCTNRLIYYKSFLLSSLICVLGSYVLLRFSTLGVYSLIIAQLGSQIIFNAWYWPRFVHKELNLNPKYVVIFGTKALLSMIKRSS